MTQYNEAYFIFKRELRQHKIIPHLSKLVFEEDEKRLIQGAFYAMFRSPSGREFMRVEDFAKKTVAFYEVTNIAELREKTPKLVYIYEQNGLYWAKQNRSQFHPKLRLVKQFSK